MARSYADRMRRFFAYLAGRQSVPHPRVELEEVRNYPTHPVVQRRVSASTQNLALRQPVPHRPW